MVNTGPKHFPIGRSNATCSPRILNQKQNSDPSVLNGQNNDEMSTYNSRMQPHNAYNQGSD